MSVVDSDLERARRVFDIEVQALVEAKSRLDESFSRAVEIMAGCSNKIVVTGMGKSGIICRKIAATLASTGSPAVFLHAAEAAHGDSGVFARGDVVVGISYSGETDETLRLLPLIRRMNLPLISITGNVSSTLAKAADATLDAHVSEEACPMGLAPTASTTLTLALGDALAVALLERKGFASEDFAVLHPAGALGRRFVQVADLMHQGDDMPVVALETPFQETVLEMTTKRLGLTGVVDDRGDLAGVVTDGDLRRALEKQVDLETSPAKSLMSAGPKTVTATALAERAIALMEEHSITGLFVTEPDSARPVGVIHLHDLLRAKIV